MISKLLKFSHTHRKPVELPHIPGEEYVTRLDPGDDGVDQEDWFRDRADTLRYGEPTFFHISISCSPSYASAGPLSVVALYGEDIMAQSPFAYIRSRSALSLV
ncbi:MAG: hypothetical protein CML23_15680 [Rhizobiaceae bacterium]|nr:hypothetical protein [Rhizobiaceae bacterium]